jgi:hypothetical protein
LDVLWNGLLTDNYARATDVSLGGCYVESAGRVGVGEPVTVVMMVTPWTHLCLRGEVVHHEWPLGFGLRFVGLTGGERARDLAAGRGVGVTTLRPTPLPPGRRGAP